MALSLDQFMSVKTCTTLISKVLQAIRVIRSASSHEVSEVVLASLTPEMVFSLLFAVGSIDLHDIEVDH